MIVSFIIIALITTYLRKDLRTAVNNPLWNKKLLYITFTSIILAVLPYTIHGSGNWLQVLGSIGLGLLLYVIYKTPLLRPYRFIIVAVLPFAITSFVSDFLKLFLVSYYKEIQRFFNNANTFASLWMIGVWVVTNVQRKELEKSRKKVDEERQKSSIMASLKAELEIEVMDRTAALRKQKEELEMALTELKTTQTQLIQSEKMASLGELTAGIAHEIQNPLNFVNNFSDVNTELIEEMEAEIEKGDVAEAIAIAKDIRDNNQKIAHHGRRADSIVKGMLQHSRASSGQKEPTDINALVDEYLRLSYHGLRAKDKSFNAKLETDFDIGIGKIKVQPQDLGRVLLNLMNNAFYAVNEKKKYLNGSYEPTVSVSTKKQNDEIVIIVEDNGTGIPQSLIDKIYQPFFTTKPTGEGTGLGLSLSYDIITKGHDGELQVETKEKEGSIFTILLPCNHY